MDNGQHDVRINIAHYTPTCYEALADLRDGMTTGQFGKIEIMQNCALLLPV